MAQLPKDSNHCLEGKWVSLRANQGTTCLLYLCDYFMIAQRYFNISCSPETSAFTNWFNLQFPTFECSEAYQLGILHTLSILQKKWRLKNGDKGMSVFFFLNVDTYVEWEKENCTMRSTCYFRKCLKLKKLNKTHAIFEFHVQSFCLRRQSFSTLNLVSFLPLHQQGFA